MLRCLTENFLVQARFEETTKTHQELKLDGSLNQTTVYIE
jgi:hypothetical protein